MDEQLAAENKDGRELRVSHLSISSDSVAPNTVKYNLQLMFADRQLLKYLFHFIGLCVLSFLPLIFAGIALAFSNPSSSAKVAIYMVTLVISLISICFSGWLSYRRLRKAINNSSSESEISDSEEDNAEFTESPGANPHTYNTNTEDQSIPPVPPLPGKQTPSSDLPLPPPPYLSNQGSPSMSIQANMPLPQVPNAPPPAPPLPIKTTQAPAPTHQAYQPNGGDGYEKRQSAYSDNNDDDGAQLYSFGTIKMHPGHSRDSDMQDRASYSMSPAAAAAKHLSNSAFTDAKYPPSQDYGYVENWVAANNQYDPSQPAHQVSHNQNAGSSIDDLVETMLESFSGQPSTVSSKALPPPPQVPLPTILPDSYGQDRTMSISADHKRKANAKRKLLQEAMAENNEDDFLDSDSDVMSSRGVSPRDTREPESKWKPSSVNYDNIAAHIAQALNQPSNSDAQELHVANQVDSYEISSASDDYDTPPASRSGPPPAPSLPAPSSAPRNGPPPAPPLP
ncbi:hypothetical protein EV183_004467 [Coemansia sp. RSA 2336]|nr:hypothetical protein EV183_004467 [Coemansia sp. RSA 2336]